nr:efflux RND transporter periplasmic adaptor subunit [uncultured Rhodopila sp.]
MDQQNRPADVEHPPPKPARRLPPRAQFSLLGFAIALLIAGFIASPAALHMLGFGEHGAASDESASQVEGQAFKATDRQWATLRIQPVTMRVFQDASQTDGKIAIDDDLVTPVYSPYTGRVTRLIAHAGDTVSRGDPLFGVQATELAQAQNDLITAVSGLKTAKAQLNLAATNEKRQHELYLAQGAAQKDWQQAQVDLANAQGGLNTAQIALAAVRSRMRILGKSDHDIDQIESTPDILQVSAETLVAAPIGGTIVQQQIGLGQNIVSASSGGSTPAYTIGDLSNVWLVANAREDDAPRLHIGDPVEVHVSAFPDRVFRAKLTYVAASIDATTHRLPVRAEVENPDGALKPEMFARFRIVTGADVLAPAVPENAIVYEGEDTHAWLANDKAKTLEIRQFKAGRISNGMVEVLDGLKPGELIVTSGAVFIDRAVTGD